jgi:hypothetical protein
MREKKIKFTSSHELDLQNSNNLRIEFNSFKNLFFAGKDKRVSNDSKFVIRQITQYFVISFSLLSYYLFLCSQMSNENIFFLSEYLLSTTYHLNF